MIPVVLLLSATTGTHASSRSFVGADTAIAPVASSDVLSNTLYYDRIQQYLDRKIQEVNDERTAYFQPDYSSLAQYAASTQVYREDLQELLAVPAACLSHELPVLKDEQYVTTFEGVEISKLELSVCQGKLTLWGLLGKPTGRTERLPLVIAYHGTSGKPEGIFGIAADAVYNDDYHHTFALRISQAGYVVFAPMLVTGFSGDYNQARNELDNRGNSLGERLVGIELGEMLSGLDYFIRLDSVNPDWIMTYGISLGGLMSFYLGALDTRIHTTVVSNYIEDRVGKLSGPTVYPDIYWKLNYVDYIFTPSLLKKFSDVEVAALIVPRRLFIETGQYDTRAIPAREVLAKVQLIYQQLGLLPDAVAGVVGPGSHEIFLNDALQFMNAGIGLSSPDKRPPVGTLEVVEGPKYVRTPKVTLRLTATDDSGVVRDMLVSEDPALAGAAWQQYVSTLSWVLAPIQGEQHIFTRYRDAAGNASSVYSASITLDSEAPTGNVIINGGAQVTRQVAVTLSLAAADTTTGVQELRSAADQAIENAPWQPFASELPWTLGGDGVKTVYVQFRDLAGNLSPVYSASITLDSEGPTGNVIINGGAQVTRQAAVTLSLAAADTTTGVQELRSAADQPIENAPWQPFASELPWTLGGGDGVKTVYVQFRDLGGNLSPVYSASITLDRKYYQNLPFIVR